MEPTGRRKAPPDDRLRAIRDRCSLGQDPGLRSAPSGLRSLANGLPIRIAVGVAHIGRRHPGASRRPWPPRCGRLHVRPCRRRRLVARHAPHDGFRGCRRGRSRQLRLQRLDLRGEARIVRRILLPRRLELLNGVGLLAQRLLVAAFQLLELSADARKLVRDGLERLRKIGR